MGELPAFTFNINKRAITPLDMQAFNRVVQQHFVVQGSIPFGVVRFI
jgi:hypothetical protein